MPRTQQSIPSLMNGVSQQPASLRHVSQCEAMINCLPNLAVGLEKRPSTMNVAKLNSNVGENAFWHVIERDATNRFVLEVAENANSDLEVYVTDLAGTAKTVTYGDVTWYSMARAVATADGAAQIIYLPAAETTIQLVTENITTATVIWEMSTTGAFAGEETTLRTDTADDTGTVAWDPAVDNGNYVRATVTAWTSGIINCYTVSKDIYYIQTAGSARDSLGATTVADYSFIINTEVPVLMDVVRLGDNSADVLDDTVQVFGDLGASPSDGDVVLITGDEATNFDEYYVRFDSTDGVWYEWFSPGENNYFDLTTMPYQVVHNANDTFTAGPGAWLEREVGDLETSPEAGFVGEFVQDIVFYRNRLGILAGESLTLSRSGNEVGGYFQFWNQSIQNVLDTDPIGINMPHEQVASLQFGKTFNEALLLFARGTQFIMDPAGTLTPLTAAISPTTEFSASPNAKPVSVGNNVYFLVDNGDNQQVREYFVQSDLGVNDANDITGHVPRYVPKNVFHLAGSSNQDMLIAISSETAHTSRVYVYKFFWTGQTKAQAAWGYWDFGTEAFVHYAAFLDSTIYLIIEYSDGVYLMTMDLNSDAGFDDIGVKVLLDRCEETTGVYVSDIDTTTWTMTYPQALDNMVVVQGSSFASPGTAPSLNHSNSILIAAQDETNYDNSPTTEGAFSGGTGHAGSDVITMNDGSTITVDAVGSGIVTQFTVTTAGGKFATNATTLTQSSTTGSGLSFTLSPDTDNLLSTTTVSAAGDHSDGDSFVGHPYTQSYTFSEQFQRKGTTDPEKTPGAVLLGRLQLRRWNVRYVDSGYFRVEVTPAGRDTHTKVFAGKVLGSNITLGTININTGTFTFDAFARSSDVTITLVNDTWLPSTFLSAEWIGTFSPKAVLPA